jgi:hypothetical protein
MAWGRRSLGLLFAALMAWLLGAPAAVSASSIKDDESVLFFPTSAYLDHGATAWAVPIHGWIFEPEEDSIWRTAAVEQMLRSLELGREAAGEDLFRQRATMFLVDNERGKQLEVRIGDREFTLPASEANGHFTGTLHIGRDEFEEDPNGAWVPVEAVLGAGDRRRFAGLVRFLPPEGVSVISDIDDTIKDSNVADKQELLANTFLRDFRAVPGMAGRYGRWAAAGAAFHYVSASPWQLFPALSSFLDEKGFPRGTVHLKTFRLKDRTFFDLFTSSEAYKVPVIEALLRAYPGRKFLLVGDSTEKDPEIYGAIARRFPTQVMHMFIRNLSQGDQNRERFRAAFREIPEGRWTVFRDPAELDSFGFETDQ